MITLAAVLRTESAMAQSGVTVIHGSVVSMSDSSAIFAAVVRTVAGHQIARADQNGTFVGTASVGDTLVIRALGFRERRTVVTGSALNIALEVSPTVLSVYTTTVGQRAIRTGDATTRATVLDRADIDGAAAIAANQLLRQIPGLQEFGAQPSQTSIAIRGLDASRVLVLIDGEPSAGALIENRDIGRLSTVGAQRIEVTKGPSSVEFGSDALGGVINLVTAGPTKQFSADAVVREGELGRKESTIGASQTIGNFGYRVNGGWRQVDRVTSVDADLATLERVYDFRSTFRYLVSDRLSLRADAQGSSERQRFPVGSGYNGFIDNQTGQGFLEAQLNALGGSLRARAFAQRYNYKFRQSQQLVPIAGTGDSLEQRERLNRFLLAYSSSVGRQTVDVGAQFSARTLIAPSKVDGDSASDDVTEFFARDSWIVGSVLANGGLRYSSSSLWGDALNPSVGLAWQAAPTVRLRANVARGFRAPSFKEIRYTFANPSAGYTVLGNPNLKPESSWATSLGATWAPVAELSLDVEGYRNNIESLIDTRLSGVNAVGLQVYKSVNVASARTEGVETNAQFTNGDWNASIGYDYLRTRDNENMTTLSGRATNTARARASREWRLLQGITTDVTTRYTGGSNIIGETSAAPAGLGVVDKQGGLLSIDAQLRVGLTKMAELSGGVNNALNQLPHLYTPAYQRQYFMALHLRWGGER